MTHNLDIINKMIEDIHHGNYPENQLNAPVFERWYDKHHDLLVIILDKKSILQDEVVLSLRDTYKISFEDLPECISNYLQSVDVTLLDVDQKNIVKNIGGLTITEPTNLAEIQLGSYVRGARDRNSTRRINRDMRIKDFALHAGSLVYFDNLKLIFPTTGEPLANPAIVLFEILDVDIDSESITIGPSDRY